MWQAAALIYKLLQQLIRGVDETFPNGNTNGTSVGRVAILEAAAFFAALLWMVHPVHSAAIDYISGRADSLACVFGCGGWLLYLRGKGIGRPLFRRAAYGLAALSALLSVCSRESGFIWIFLFLFHLFVFDRKAPVRTKLFVLTCCIAVTGVYAGLRQLPAKSLVNDVSSSKTPFGTGSLDVAISGGLRAIDGLAGKSPHGADNRFRRQAREQGMEERDSDRTPCRWREPFLAAFFSTAAFVQALRDPFAFLGQVGFCSPICRLPI